MNMNECPIKGCSGWSTSSGKPNLFNHIKNIAKTELLFNYITGTGKTPHADWLKANVTFEPVISIKIAGKTFYNKGFLKDKKKGGEN